MTDEEANKIPTGELESKITEWIKQKNLDLNQNVVGLPLTDISVMAHTVSGLVDDVDQMMKWVRLLTNKIKVLENK